MYWQWCWLALVCPGPTCHRWCSAARPGEHGICTWRTQVPPSLQRVRARETWDMYLTDTSTTVTSNSQSKGNMGYDWRTQLPPSLQTVRARSTWDMYLTNNYHCHFKQSMQGQHGICTWQTQLPLSLQTVNARSTWEMYLPDTITTITSVKARSTWDIFVTLTDTITTVTSNSHGKGNMGRDWRTRLPPSLQTVNSRSTRGNVPAGHNYQTPSVQIFKARAMDMYLTNNSHFQFKQGKGNMGYVPDYSTRSSNPFHPQKLDTHSQCKTRYHDSTYKKMWPFLIDNGKDSWQN